MSKFDNLVISVLPITNKIVIGKLNKARTKWLDGRRDITNEAINAVMEFLHEDKCMYENTAKSTGEIETLALLKEDEVRVLEKYRKELSRHEAS